MADSVIVSLGSLDTTRLWRVREELYAVARP